MPHAIRPRWLFDNDQSITILARHDQVLMLSTVLIWRHIALCGLHWDLWYFKLVFNFKFKGISCAKMHMASIIVRYGLRWHSDKPYQTRLRLIRYDLSECHLNPYRTRMDATCISYYVPQDQGISFDIIYQLGEVCEKKDFSENFTNALCWVGSRISLLIVT